MAKVSLRVYNREIESLIEGGQFPEAVAHCLHILRTYPMHLETYRLLGKAFLEGKKFANAADIFQRVLTAVPDDFVSHVGMSIINDDENRLDEAIWHMERAFEVQPSNPGITAELKRLYGRREGVEPPKIRLTRDALANMYTQGELYNQAIAEIRSVLSEDPNRPDLQIMLARAYFRGGQKVQATEMCSALLKRFKYCLDALRILVEILPGTGRAENVPAYRQRVIALDPYAAYVSGSVFQSDQVQDAAVGLERLEYDGSTALPQLDWASSLGIHLDEESSPAAIPDWLNVPEDELQHGGQGIAQPAGPDEVEVPAGGEAIPDFMKDAGWQPSTSDGQEAIPPLPLGGETGIPAASPAVPAEIPDWIKSMAPADAFDQLPDAETVDEPLPAEAGVLPGWLDGRQPEEAPAPAGDAPQAEGLPDWLTSASGGTATAPTPEESLPAAGNDIPQPAPGSELPTEDDQDAALAWLEGLAAKQGAKPEELLTKPEERPQDAPEWVNQITADRFPPPATPSTELPEDDEELEFPPISPVAGLPQIPPQAPVGGEVHAPVHYPAATVEEGDTLDWLHELSGDEVGKTGGVEKADAVVGPTDTAGQPAVPTVESAAQDDDISVTTWLKRIERPEDEPPVTPVDGDPQAVDGGDDLPDWLKGPEPATGDTIPASTAPVAASTPDAPGWLSTADGKEGLQADSDLPDWLADEGSPNTDNTVPTRPAEWLPVEESLETAGTPSLIGNEPAPPQEIPPARPKPTGVLARVPNQDKESDILLEAQEALEHSRLNEAIEAYTRLIKKGRLLEEVIHDLREAIYRFPVDMIVWQTLGDAYMRANRLQEALDAYTKAEELLR